MKQESTLNQVKASSKNIFRIFISSFAPRINHFQTLELQQCEQATKEFAPC
jgi:hypothetical protein